MSQSLAWTGIGLVALGMALAFVAVVTGGREDPEVGTARVQTTSPDEGAPILPLPATGTTAGGGSTTGAGDGGASTPSGGSNDHSDTGAGGTATTGAGEPQPGTQPQTTGDETTLTTAATGSLDERLAETAPTAGFVVFGLDQPGWRITALDAGGHGDSAYVTLAYENGEDYINLSQSPSGTRPSLADAQPVEIRGLTGEIYEMQPVLLLRWDEEGTGLLFSSDLSRERALALAGRLRPLR